MLYMFMCCDHLHESRLGSPLSEMEEYRVEVCIAARQLERLDKDEFTEDERADAEEVSNYYYY